MITTARSKNDKIDNGVGEFSFTVEKIDEKDKDKEINTTNRAIIK